MTHISGWLRNEAAGGRAILKEPSVLGASLCSGSWPFGRVEANIGAMRTSILATALFASVAQAQAAPARVDRAEHHEFVIANFRTESGVTLPEARIVYGTYGHLNAAHDNVVLLPSH